ncbi:DUF6907 domain-containing protein [Streptomyces sp. NPDC101118]|uniref:DUF6907 domain-containing protein n=1 Tax=Streptomyces sp. NPDC101118 TaxID=3366109 RepID=UPI0037FBE1D5
MTAPRTVVVPTLDHGPVTLTCPRWCVEPHTTPEHRADISHTGPEHRFAFGGTSLLVAMLSADPFGPAWRRPTALYVEQQDFARTLAPDGLRQLAAAYAVQAHRLRTLADELSVLLSGGGQ